MRSEWVLFVTMHAKSTDLSCAKMYLSSSKWPFRSQETPCGTPFFLVPVIQCVSLEAYALLNFFNFELE